MKKEDKKLYISLTNKMVKLHKEINDHWQKGEFDKESEKEKLYKKVLNQAISVWDKSEIENIFINK